jgi:phosphohistidine phosphatase
MKTLLLIRHAKSDWSIPGIADFDRPLNARGYSDAHRMGRNLKKNISGNIVLVSSPAVRALTTALIIAHEVNYPLNKIQLQPDLYEAEAEDYEKVISFLEDQYDTAFIFGHNPTISEVVRNFSDANAIELPTCSVSVFKFQTKEWATIMSSKGVLQAQLFPKSLTE